MAKRMTTAGMAAAMATNTRRETRESVSRALMTVCRELAKAEAEGRVDLLPALTTARDLLLARLLARETADASA